MLFRVDLSIKEVITDISTTTLFKIRTSMELNWIIDLSLSIAYDKNALKNCVKSVQTRFFFWSVFHIFGMNTGKYGPEKNRIWTLFTQ